MSKQSWDVRSAAKQSCPVFGNSSRGIGHRRPSPRAAFTSPSAEPLPGEVFEARLLVGGRAALLKQSPRLRVHAASGRQLRKAKVGPLLVDRRQIGRFPCRRRTCVTGKRGLDLPLTLARAAGLRRQPDVEGGLYST
jgi:hypothetical protein